MKESIYTIPISEVFEPKSGCPLCALHKALEERWLDYITGAAMMEPDVRTETNRQGFCARHFKMMLTRRNRLSIALMLQTRLAWVDESLATAGAAKPSLFAKKLAPEQHGETCFVCSAIGREFERIGGNIAALWARDAEFRQLFADQDFLCLPHYSILATTAANTLRPADSSAFTRESSRLTRKKLKQAKADIDAFCNLFDYRNAGSGMPAPEIAGAIETAIAYLTGDGV